MSRALIAPEMLAGEYLFKRYGATVADYERAANEDTRLELIDGVLIMHSPANVRHERLFSFLHRLLSGYAGASKQGEVFGSRTPVLLEEDRRVEPDLLFIKPEHLKRLGEVALAGPADIIVEILSPATREYDLTEKRDLYAEAGVPEYWIVDPMEERLLVDRPAGARVTEVGRGRFESQVLPGFWLDAAWLWQQPLPDPQGCLAEVLRKA